MILLNRFQDVVKSYKLPSNSKYGMKAKVFLFLMGVAVGSSALSNVYMVTNNASGGTGTLRTAISSANSNPGKDTIYFDLPNNPAGRIINLSMALPNLNEAVLIDATSNSGNFYGNSHAKVTIKPATASTNIMNCFWVNADDCEIYGLFIKGFQTGIEFPSSGLRSNCRIGSPGKGNVISGCATTAIEMWNVANSQVSDNFIGVDTTGNVAMPSAAGIDSWIKLRNVIIGGPDISYRNIISGNNGTGMLLSNVDSVYVQNNWIGIGFDGLTAVPNTGPGLQLGLNEALHLNSVVESNLVSGNGGSGIHADAYGLIVRNNRVGTNASGTSAVPNMGAAGIAVFKRKVTIADNLVSGNANNGINLSFVADSCVIIQNTVGLSLDYGTAIPNVDNGMEILSNNVVIGNNELDGNIIGGNGQSGLSISGNGVIVKGNSIGFNPITGAPMGNGAGGILLSASDESIIGGLLPGERNKIAHNTGAGISEAQSTNLSVWGNVLENNSTNGLVVLNANSGMSILGNKIGNIDAGNGTFGIRFLGVSSNLTLGSAEYPNHIIGNGSEGIFFTSAMSGVSLYNNRFSCNNQVVSGAGAYYVNGANNGIQPGTAVLLGSEITGTTAPNRRIDVFYNPSNCLTCEGLVFYTTLISDVLGNWSTSISPTLGSWTIMETADNGSSSNFSGCQTLTFCDDLILPSSVEACLDENVVIETNATGQWYNSNETGNLNHVAQGNEVLFYIADTPEGACLDSVSVLINPGDLYYADEDMDGYGNPNNSTQSCWIPLGFVSNASDCEDSDAMVNPGMIEICNDMDDDCDLTVDEDLNLILQFSDQDGDGFGSMMSGFVYCSLLPGYTTLDGDCDDDNMAISPAALEDCNALDDNCNNEIDEGLEIIQQYLDVDGDGFGDNDQKVNNCMMLAGYVLIGGDCNDGDALINPNAAEIMDNGVDENCDGEIGVGISEGVALESVRMMGGDCVLKGFAHERARILDNTGRTIYETTLVDDTERISTMGMSTGIYSVQAGKKMYRIVVVR